MCSARVIFLQVPPQINSTSFDGQLCLYGPEEWHIQSFRTGKAEYVLPVPGDFYIFPAWQPHSVAPFRGDGERWSLAFNVMAIPKRVDVNPVTTIDNVELFSVRKRPQGF